MSKESMSLLIVGGILAIIAGCLGGLFGMLALIKSFGPPYINQDPELVSKELLVGGLGFIAFVPGLAGGILTLRRKEYIACIISIGFLLLFSVIATLVSFDFVTLSLSASTAVLTFSAAIMVTAARRRFHYSWS